MKKIKIILTVLLLALAGAVYSQERSSFSPFFFIQLTDPQFGFFDSNNGFSKETETFEKAVSAINKLNPDFVVITGDLVNNKEDALQKAEFKRVTSEINSNIPVYYAPGNHDLGQSPTQKDIDSFISDYGHDIFSFTNKNCLFIGLNSVIIKADSSVLEQQQYDWLEKELSKGQSTVHKIIFCHHPFFIRKYNERETYSNIPRDKRNRYLSLFREFKVDAIFAGHLHNNGYAKYGDLEMITTSSVGKPLAAAPSGIRIVKVYYDKIVSNYYGLNEIPQKIYLDDNLNN